MGMEDSGQGLPSFGSKYRSRRAELRQRIRQGTISALESSVEAEAAKRGYPRFTCFFCNKPIPSSEISMHVLTDVRYYKKGEGMISSYASYYLHDNCYHDALRFQYEADSEACDEHRLCLN